MLKCAQMELTPSHTLQVIALPVLRPEVTPWLLYHGQCLACRTQCQASLSADHASGDGPRLTGCIGEMAGMVGASHRAVHAL